ncbi:MAG: proline iminopeptidase [Arcticibacterium sp.]|jgi:proline iminopeptidase
MKNILLLFTSFLFMACESLELESFKQTINVSFQGADMPVYLHGNSSSDKIIVIIHGGPGGNGLEYRLGTWKDELEEKYLMAYWDQRGQGMSQGKDQSDVLTVAQMSADLDAVVRTLKSKFGQEKKIILHGHSWGGTVGTHFMVNPAYQKNVAGWIEADGAHDIPFLNTSAIELFENVAEEQIARGNSTDYWTEILDWVASIDKDNISLDEGGEINTKGFEAEGTLANDGILATGEGSFEDIKVLLFSPINQLSSFISGNSANNILTPEIETTAFTDQLYLIEKPCLFLWGAYDFVVPKALGEDAFQKVSSTQKELIIFEQSGHSPMSSEPGKYTAAVVDFIEKL